MAAILLNDEPEAKSQEKKQAAQGEALSGLVGEVLRGGG